MNICQASISNSGVSFYSPAKINLHLDVGKKREDGFHNLQSIFQTISLADIMTVQKTETGFELFSLPEQLPANNTISHAFTLFTKRARISKGVCVSLIKNIPSGAGLGGGSSNAAAFLYALNELFDKALSFDALCELGAQVGSDVPFFLRTQTAKTGAAIVSGRGERVQPIQARNDGFGLLIVPQVFSSTRKAFAALDAFYEHNKKKTAFSLRDLEQMYQQPFSKWSFYNSFEPVLFAQNPYIQKAFNDLQEQNPDFARMSGSGSSIFGLFSSKDAVLRAFKALQKKYHCKFFLLLAFPAIKE